VHFIIGTGGREGVGPQHRGACVGGRARGIWVLASPRPDQASRSLQSPPLSRLTDPDSTPPSAWACRVLMEDDGGEGGAGGSRLKVGAWNELIGKDIQLKVSSRVLK
jgi:hypothetical protein